MTQPFDPKDLVAKLKDKGLDLAEEAAKLVAESVLDWVTESVVATENKFDDLLIAVVPIVKQEVLKYIDKIDGQVG